MQGVLLVDKPQGWTSFDVVNFVRKIVAAANGTKPKNTKWTVVGFYEDNMQPYVDHIMAESPQAAAEKTISKTEENLRVVEVFKGANIGRLNNNEVL